MTGIRLPHKIMGPNGKWWIDEEGNMFLAGDLVVEEGIDPTFFTCDSQGSAPASNNIIVVVSNVLDFKNSGGTVSPIQLSALPDSTVSTSFEHISQTTSGLETDTVATDIISVDAAANKVWIIGSFIWAKESDECEGGAISGTLAETCVPVSTTGSNNGSIGGTVFQTVHAPGSTGNKTYNITASKNDPNKADILGGTIVLLEGK